MLDPADIYFTDFFEFKIRVTILHGLWIISSAGKQEEEKEAIRAQMTRIATANPRFLDFLPEDLKNFVIASTCSTSPLSPQPCGDAGLPSPATGVRVGVFRLSPVSPQQRTSAVVSSPQPVAASSATFTSAVAAPASTTMVSRRRQRPRRHRGLQQHEFMGPVMEVPHLLALPRLSQRSPHLLALPRLSQRSPHLLALPRLVLPRLSLRTMPRLVLPRLSLRTMPRLVLSHQLEVQPSPSSILPHLLQRHHLVHHLRLPRRRLQCHPPYLSWLNDLDLVLQS
ncbi:uncharacterized protein LOC109204076 [Oreochromis niloticus]|uniref:uncharacterized protein LOC109204076 n=1 Tax=Oreochromis niloticus TaxID=8128 RepID=UPI000DF3FC31|nr:uncharacterized protein LOC109204076 [Oreochromis niloticus]XP_025766994.1 uncharacterized protein LOC109204076 [Oreochromis niloticus]